MAKNPVFDEKLHPQGQRLWHTYTDNDERCLAVVDTVDRLQDAHATRFSRMLANIELYEGKRLGGLYPAAYLQTGGYSTEEYDRLQLNEARAVVNTAIAKIASIGYTSLEVMGYANGKFFGLTPKEFATVIKDNNL